MRSFIGSYQIPASRKGNATWKWVFMGDPSPKTRKPDIIEYLFHGTESQKESTERHLIAEERKHGRKLIRTRRIEGI